MHCKKNFLGADWEGNHYGQAVLYNHYHCTCCGDEFKEVNYDY